MKRNIKHELRELENYKLEYDHFVAFIALCLFFKLDLENNWFTF